MIFKDLPRIYGIISLKENRSGSGDLKLFSSKPNGSIVLQNCMIFACILTSNSVDVSVQNGWEKVNS